MGLFLCWSVPEITVNAFLVNVGKHENMKNSKSLLQGLIYTYLYIYKHTHITMSTFTFETFQIHINIATSTVLLLPPLCVL